MKNTVLDVEEVILFFLKDLKTRFYDNSDGLSVN